MKHSGNLSAFSLIEIVLAMGIISFTLTSIMGVLSVSMGSSKASTDDTVIAAMVNDVVGDLRRQSFDAAKNYVQAASSPVVFFDSCGRRLRNNTGMVDLDRPSALAAGAVYQCTQTAQTDNDTSSANGTANMLRANLVFTWPAAAIPPPNSRVIHASIARYN